MEVRVYYEDTDCGGVVYYANYLRYIERARTEYLREREVDLVTLMEGGIIFVVRSVQVGYKSSARYNDLLSIDTELTPGQGLSPLYPRHTNGERQPSLMPSVNLLVSDGAESRSGYRRM